MFTNYSTMRSFKSERGIFDAIIVILVLIVFGAIIVALKLQGDLGIKRTQQDELIRNIREAEAKNSQLTARSLEAGPPVGYKGELSNMSADAAKVRDYLKEKRTKLEINEKLINTLEGTIPELSKRVYYAEIELMHIEQFANMAKDRELGAKEIKPKIVEMKVKELENYKARAESLNSQINEISTKFEEQKAGLGKDTKAILDKIAEENTTHAEDIKKLQEKIQKLQNQILGLKGKEIITHNVYIPLGRIVKADAINKAAFINIGSDQRVVAGLKFLVGKEGKLGKPTYKAEILVKKANSNWSQVAITKLYDADHPILEDDLIYNYLFNTKRPLKLIITETEGGISQTKFTVNEAKLRILDIGDYVSSEVNVDTDVIIAFGDNIEDESNEKIKKARELNIPVLTSTEAFKFIAE